MIKKERKQSSMKLMILTIVAVFLVVLMTIAGFFMIHKQEKVKISASLDTEQSLSDSAVTQDMDDTETGESEVEDSDGFSDEQSAKEEENNETGESVYLIPGNEKSSDRYERVAHLSYTSTEKYTVEDLAELDSQGLKITRNEIYARHGRIFNDQELQEYFQHQSWYVPKVAADDFDESCLNEVERYNVELISSYEQKMVTS